MGRNWHAVVVWCGRLALGVACGLHAAQIKELKTQDVRKRLKLAVSHSQDSYPLENKVVLTELDPLK